MLRVWLHRALPMVLLLLIATPAYAGGVGLFLSGGGGQSDWSGDFSTVESDGRHLDYGFTIDSNLATDRLFNYRMELGRSQWQVDSFDNRGVDVDLKGLAMTHDFGFGALLTPPVRLWFGPELRFTLVEGNVPGVQDRDIDAIGIGFGGVVGLNFNLPGRLTLAAKTSFVMMRYSGSGPEWNGSTWRSSDFDIDEDLVTLGISMYFRTRSRH